MTVLHFTHELPRASGVATFVRELHNALHGLGVDSRIVLNPKELPQKPGKRTIIHIHGMWKPVYHQVAKWADSNGVKIVWSTHGMTAPWSLKHKWWKKCLYWLILQKPDLKRAAIIHSTVEQEREWNAALGFKRHVIAPLGTHLPQASEVKVKDKGEQRTLLFVGRVYPVKALDRLIEAFAKANVDGWKLRIVGPDQAGHMEELINLCQRLGLSWAKRRYAVDSQSEAGVGIQVSPNSACPEGTCVPKIEFAGPKFGAELEAEYENCDCLALVSHTENFGATVVDAMAHGKPVITSTKTPWMEVADLGCGWWVDNDIETLAATLRSTLNTPTSTLEAMGKRGRKLVEEKYTWPAVANAMLNCYKELCHEG